MERQEEKQFSVKTYEVEETPFTVIERYEGVFEIVIGRNIVTEKTFETLGQAIAYIDSKPWNLLCIATAIMYDTYSQHLNQQREKEQEELTSKQEEL